MNGILNMIDRNVPSNATMGIIIGEDDWDYPFSEKSLHGK